MVGSKKKYIFKMNFAEMQSYREIKVETHDDQEAKELVKTKFQNDPFVYLIEDLDSKKLYRITYEIEGGKLYESKGEDPSGHEQTTKVSSRS